MATIRVPFQASGLPAEGLTVAPTIRIRRKDTQALVVTDANMTELGDGIYFYDFTPDPAREYGIRANGDPTSTGQVDAGVRYAYGSLSGPKEANEALIGTIDTKVTTIDSKVDTIDTVVDDTNTKTTLIDKRDKNRKVLDPATGLLTVYDDDDTSVLETKEIYSDAAGTNAYNGSAAPHRENQAT